MIYISPSGASGLPIFEKVTGRARSSNLLVS